MIKVDITKPITKIMIFHNSGNSFSFRNERYFFFLIIFNYFIFFDNLKSNRFLIIIFNIYNSY
jgi:hypothetical protein